MSIAHPIARAWLSTGAAGGRSTGSQNYDEFAEDSEITTIIAANPASALAVEMPHLAPDSAGTPFEQALPLAAERLSAAKADGRYRRHDRIVALYRIRRADGPAGYGLWTMIDCDQISTRPDQPGLVIRNEDVFLDKVRERVALARATGHLLSPVLLLATDLGDALHAALIEAIDRAGDPDVTDTDQAGRTHEVWALGPGPRQDELLALAGGGELVVADGNHRSLAAQTAGLARFLAVVTTPASVTIEPYNRLVTESPLPQSALLHRLDTAGARVVPERDGVRSPLAGGSVTLYGPDGGYSVVLPGDPAARMVDNLDHALVERVLLGGALGLDPGDKRIMYVGGDYPASWLVGEVDAGRADLAVLVAPVTVTDFVAVNLARQKLPRKSTWFSPKARAGLVAADLAAEPRAAGSQTSVGVSDGRRG